MNVAFKNLLGHLSIANLLRIFWPPMLVFVSHVFISYGLHLYILFPNIDIPVHYLGGLTMAYSCVAALAFLQQHKIISILDKAVEWLFVFTLVTTIAVCWEFAEFSMDRLLGTNVQINLQNTMQDLLMGMLGAASMVGYKIFKKSS